MKKLIAFLSAVALCAGIAFAQDADFSDDFSSDFGSDFSSDFGDDSSSSGSGFSETKLEIGGEAQIDFRAYVDDTDTSGLPIDEWETKAFPKGKINLKYANDSVFAEAKFGLSEDTIKNHPQDIIDELTLAAYLGNWEIQAGKMKVVWGKGDKLHVIDNFNANDYKDFLSPDYIDRRISEPMIRAIYNVPKDVGPFTSTKFEFVWTPFITADRYAESGRWVPTQVNQLKQTLTGYATDAISDTVGKLETARRDLTVGRVKLENATSSTDTESIGLAMLDASDRVSTYNKLYLAQLSNSSSLADDLYPNVYQLKYMQAGVRFTTTTGSWDWGLSYYFGRDKRASFDYSKMKSFVTKHLAGTDSEDDKFIDYDFLQVFGIEAAKTIGAYNFRAEAAYNLTQDVAGDDPTIHNNSVAWVFGFDRDLPISELNINIQNQGKYIINHNKIYASGDTESNTYTTDNKLVVNISDNLCHSKVKPEISAIYGFEHFDLIIMPKVTWYVSDGLELSATGMYMANFVENRKEFGDWTENSFVQVGAKYTF